MFIDKEFMQSELYLGPKFKDDAEESQYFANLCNSHYQSGVRSFFLIGSLVSIHPDYVVLLLHQWCGLKREDIESSGYVLTGAIAEVIK